jgi:hypothetical protein
MRNRTISLLSILLAVSAIPAAAQITITPGSSSSTLVNGHHPELTVTAPVGGALDSLDSTFSGGSWKYFVAFSASVDSFMLNATTSGDWPCEGSFSGQPPIIADNAASGWKGEGQAIYVMVDNGAARLVTNTSAPSLIPVPSNTPGPHTLRACMLRSTDESVKDADSISPLRRTSLYTVLTFYIGTNTGAHAIDTTEPLLMPNAPLDTSTYVYPPDSVLLDFYVMFKPLANDYVVEATIYDSTMSELARDTLNTMGPHCVGGLEEPPNGTLGKYFVRMRLLDDGGDPVTNGPGNFNDRTWAFWVRKP